MGMYTGLRVKVTVKEEYRSMINQINRGAGWSEFSEEFPFLSNYALQTRAGLIPNGSLSYMPSSWATGEYPNETPTDGFDTKIDMDTGYWTFQCSLKNYEGEIEQFFSDVLVNIISDSEHIEYFYEEWDESKYYEFVDGTIKLKPE
ncbi:hypothetical protein [Bacillus subtilis]|uniref:hypothetical protein n=1 Tax=Bacillus subtilis TaxID=1423 RepID=UPI003F6E2115